MKAVGEVTPRKVLHALAWASRHLRGKITAEEVGVLQSYLDPSDVCLDVGAHGGGWSIPLSLYLRKGHVYAFEALPYYADVLALTVRILRRRNVSIINAAVGDSDATVRIVWKDASGKRLTGMTRMAARDEKVDDTVSVRGMRLDSFWPRMGSRRIRLVKCDVEGAELLVLKGSVNLIQTWRPLFYCELYEQYCRRYEYSANTVFDFLRERGYLAALISRQRDLMYVSGQEYCGSGDVLFIPREERGLF